MAFNRRTAELDIVLCRLALFLDPRYKAGAGHDIKVLIVKVLEVSSLNAHKSSLPALVHSKHSADVHF